MHTIIMINTHTFSMVHGVCRFIINIMHNINHYIMHSFRYFEI